MDYYLMYPPPYDTTIISESFPEHRYPFAHARRQIENALRHHPEQYMHTPRIDVRETVARFYIDIELPGLESKENLTVSWANRRTLLVNATITRSAVEEESAKETNGKGAASAEKESSKNVVHLLVQERQIGQYHRAFSLPVDIDHEALVAKLQFGVLRITLTKEKQEQVKEKAIEVEHTGA